MHLVLKRSDPRVPRTLNQGHLGVKCSTGICLEPPSKEIEQFLTMMRFQNRGKLAELPKGLMEVYRDFDFSA